jgi:NADPH:quinone reductase-like Zn-dependent oxidoreductase
MILGSDASGTLDDGTPMVVHPMVAEPGWTPDSTIEHEHLLSEVHPGTFAEAVWVPPRNLCRKPPGMDWDDAACLGTAWLTAYGMLFVTGGLRPGQRVLVQGATGGVASALIQLARAAGLIVLATARDENKRAFAADLGAHEVYAPGAKISARVDAVMETVGAATWGHSLRCVRPGGAVVVAGATTGGTMPAELDRVFFRRLRILGAAMGTMSHLEHLIQFLEATRLRPRIGARYPLDQARQGFLDMAAGRTWGKVIFHHPDAA